MVLKFTEVEVCIYHLFLNPSRELHKFYSRQQRPSVRSVMESATSNRLKDCERERESERERVRASERASGGGRGGY